MTRRRLAGASISILAHEAQQLPYVSSDAIDPNYLLPFFGFFGPSAPGSLTAIPARSLLLDLLDLTEERAAGFPPGFFPNLTSTPLSGAPAMAITGASTMIAATPTATSRDEWANLFIAVLRVMPAARRTVEGEEEEDKKQGSKRKVILRTRIPQRVRCRCDKPRRHS